MIIQAAAARNVDWDVIIVGAGAVGLTMGTDLASAGRKVLLVEGGAAATLSDFAKANGGISNGRHHDGFANGRYKGLGGTTRLWGGQLMKLSVSDMQSSANLNKPGWPISPAEIGQWQNRALQDLGIRSDWTRIAAHWSAASGSPTALNDELEMHIAVWLGQPDFTKLFAKMLNSMGGLAVVLETQAIGLLADEAKGAIAGVRVRTRGEVTDLSSRDVVLAAGTIETSAILLRAQANLPRSALAANGHVGRWFVDHLHGFVGTAKLTQGKAMGQLFDAVHSPDGKLTAKLALAPAVLRNGDFANCALTLSSGFGVREVVQDLGNLIRRVGSGDSAETLRRAGLLAPLVWRYLVSRRSSNFMSGEIKIGIEVEQLPNDDSFLFLETGVPIEHAQIGINWNVSGRELPGVARLTDAFARYCRMNQLADVMIDPRVAANDSGILDDCADAYHQIGGARMAASAELGVVDGHGAVFGMPGLHVAGAATFPSASFVNPTLPAIALGLRLAQKLARC